MAHTPGAPSAPGGRRHGDGTGRDRPRIVLDDVSKQIIEQLQQDGRRSYAAIGKAVGLSEAAVRQRVQRLAEAGVMQVVAVTDPLMLGFRRQTMIGVRCVGAIEPVVRLAHRGRLRGRRSATGDHQPRADHSERDKYGDIRVPEALQADL